MPRIPLIMISLFVFGFSSCAQPKVAVPSSDQIMEWDGEQLDLSDEEWKAKLNQQQYHVLRQQGTERAFTGEYWNNKTPGIYSCAGCGLALFDAETKFKSGTGWPSYYQPINENHVAEEEDLAHGWVRTEVHCNRCGGHLGHIFPDGPEPTGLRYCINSVSLTFTSANEAVEEGVKTPAEEIPAEPKN